MNIINPGSLMAPRGYNQGMLFPCGKLLFVAGQIGWDKEGRLASGLVAQFELALSNVMEVVREAGGNAECIARFTLYVKDKSDYLAHRKEIGQSYRSVIGKHYAAMSLIVVKDLLEEGALVEIEATAILS